MEDIAKLIKGETALKDLMRKMGRTIDWSENIGHAGEITIYRNEYYRDENGEYQNYYLLTMPHPNGTLQGYNDAHEWAKEQARKGLVK